MSWNDKQSRDELYLQVLASKRLDSQVSKLVEELAELIRASSRLNLQQLHVATEGDVTALDDFISELADVSIMVEQMELFLTSGHFGYYDGEKTAKLLLDKRDNKLDRLFYRLQEGTL
jgi:NTP pyrophosphatase (non-canonical NTP hydrolase)